MASAHQCLVPWELRADAPQRLVMTRLVLVMENNERKHCGPTVRNADMDAFQRMLDTARVKSGAGMAIMCSVLAHRGSRCNGTPPATNVPSIAGTFRRGEDVLRCFACSL